MEYRDFGTESLYTKLLKVQNLFRVSKLILEKKAMFNN